MDRAGSGRDDCKTRLILLVIVATLTPTSVTPCEHFKKGNLWPRLVRPGQSRLFKMFHQEILSPQSYDSIKS